MNKVLKLPTTKKKARHAWTLSENKYLTLDDVRKLRRFCRQEKQYALKTGAMLGVRNWFMIELGLNAGFRVKEMAGLKCGDILIDKEHSSIVAIGKRLKKRSIWISSEFKKTCLWYLRWKQKMGQEIQPESYVFTTAKAKTVDKRTLQKAFKKCVARAGLPGYYSIHCLRHTFGSHLYLSSNHNLRLVQEQLGHSSVRVTEVYASLMNTDAKEAVEKLYIQSKTY